MQLYACIYGMTYTSGFKPLHEVPPALHILYLYDTLTSVSTNELNQV